jgi:hypothetical protein
MDLKDQPREQVTDCLTWMRDVASLQAPPSPLIWAEICQGLAERAHFLEEFVVPKIALVERHLFEGQEKPSDRFTLSEERHAFLVEEALPPTVEAPAVPFLTPGAKDGAKP